MLLEQLSNDGVVQVMVGGVLVTCGNAVTGQDSTVHGLGGVDDGGQGALGVNTVNIGVVQQALSLQHVQIANARQAGQLLQAFLDTVGLVGLDLVGSDVAAQLTDEGSCAQASETNSALVVVLLGASDGLNDQNQVQGRRERGVLSAGAGHVDDALLEADDLTAGNDCSTLQNMGTAGTNSVDLGDDTGEHAAGALNLNTGLDNVLNRGDANIFAGFCDVKFDGLDVSLYVIILVDESLNVLCIDIQNAVFDSTFACELDIIDLNETEI